jgi:tetratricopeptide (TPR) repeat protein
LEVKVELKLKTISRDGIAEAMDKAQLYRCLGEPEEAESICHDVLAAEPNHQLALRTLGLAITDQFTGQGSDRYSEVDSAFRQLTDSYERSYYSGILYERRAKAEMRAGHPHQAVVSLLEEAMRHFAKAEEMRPASNDDAILRWNRCVRLLEKLPEVAHQAEIEEDEIAPVLAARRRVA